MTTDREGSPARTPIDPVTLELIGNALDSIAEEAGEVLVRASHSPTIKERRDSSTALFDRQGLTLCQAAHIPIHLGSLMGVVGAVIERHPIDTIAENDVFIGNDAYTGGGTHLNDIVLVEPIFVDGRIEAWTTNLAHHADFADRSHAHIFQEGLRIPPVKLYAGGVLQKDILDLILLNCQVPRERIADLRAQAGANKVAVERYRDLCRRYGTATLTEAGAALMDYAERRVRSAIETIPDGSYFFEDDFDHPDIPDVIRLAVTVTVRGSEIWLAFEAPRQIRAGLNIVWAALSACTYYAVKVITDPEAPANAGLYRPIHIEAPLGSMLNCAAPAAVYGRAGLAQRIVDLVHGALAPAIPDRITAAHNGAMSANTISGIDPRTGRFYVYGETIGGGFGARATKDGLDGVHVHMTNTSNLPVEVLETDYPIFVDAYELVRDSGGAGTWRGGMGIRRRIRIEAEECQADIRGGRVNRGPWGLFGGHEGGRFGLKFEPPLAGPWKKNSRLTQGQMVEIVTPGAGGYGDPHQRNPELVRRDLREDRISAAAAREIYGLDDTGRAGAEEEATRNDKD